MTDHATHLMLIAFAWFVGSYVVFSAAMAIYVPRLIVWLYKREAEREKATPR